MTTFSHASLTLADGEHRWVVFGRLEDIDDERLERDAPGMESWDLALAAVGSRGWELVSVTEGDGDTRLWFKRASDWRPHVPDVVDL